MTACSGNTDVAYYAQYTPYYQENEESEEGGGQRKYRSILFPSSYKTRSEN